MNQDLRARVLAEVARTPSQTRAEFTRRVLLVSAIGALATASLFFALGGLAPGTRPFELIAFTSGFGLLAAIILTRLGSISRGPMLGPSRTMLLSIIIATAPILALVALGATMVWPKEAAEPVSALSTLSCGILTVVQGALPLVALLVPRRGTDPVHPAITGAALGMTAGAWTVMMSYLRCPHTAATHTIVAHVVPTLVLAGLGAGLGWLMLRLRS